MLDYLVVGMGLAGSAICEVLESRGKSFKIIDDGGSSASRVAAGLMNPVVIKRLNAVWRASELLPIAIAHYRGLEKKYEAALLQNKPIYRRFTGPEEQNNWFTASDRKALKDFLSDNLVTESIPGLDAPFHYGEVNGSYKLDVPGLLDAQINYLDSKDRIIKENFRIEELVEGPEFIDYRGVKAKHLVLACGVRLLEMNGLDLPPIKPSKGEYVYVDAPELRTDVIINAGVFIMPEDERTYRIGATYHHQEDWQITDEARNELLGKLKKLQIKCTVRDQTAGVRPTVADRKPILGKAPGRKRAYHLNGLGSRGVLFAPAMAQQLIEYIERGDPLWPEVDIERFTI